MNGLAHSLRKRRIPGQCERKLVGYARREPRIEEARRDGIRPNAHAAEISGHDERHAGNAGFRRGVGNLADLSFKCCNGRGVDDAAALAVLVGLVARHLRRYEAGDVEGRNQVQIDDSLKLLERMGPFPGQSSFRQPAAGRVAAQVHGAQGFDRFVDGFLGPLIVHHVARVKSATESFRHRGAIRSRQIEYGHVATLFAKNLCRGQRHARRAADEYCVMPFYFHFPSSKRLTSWIEA